MHSCAAWLERAHSTASVAACAGPARLSSSTSMVSCVDSWLGACPAGTRLLESWESSLVFVCCQSTLKPGSCDAHLLRCLRLQRLRQTCQRHSCALRATLQLCRAPLPRPRVRMQGCTLEGRDLRLVIASCSPSCCLSLLWGPASARLVHTSHYDITPMSIELGPARIQVRCAGVHLHHEHVCKAAGARWSHLL